MVFLEPFVLFNFGTATTTPGPDNLASPEAFDALVRPYQVAITGTSTLVAFDPITKLFDLAYDTIGPGDVRYAHELVTVVPSLRDTTPATR